MNTKIAKLSLGLLISLPILFSCSEEDQTVIQSASLTVVHAASGAPGVHVDYFGQDIENLNFSINPTLSFAANDRFVIPANQSRPIHFTYALDTSTVVFIDEVSLSSGQIATYFLLGDSANLFSVIINDTGLRTFQDSLNAIRFINLAEGIESLSVGIQDSTIALAAGLGFSQSSEFIEVDAILENEAYDFTFKDDADSVLASFRLEQWRILIFPIPDFEPIIIPSTVRKNVTLALVGDADGGEGSSTLQVVRIDNY